MPETCKKSRLLAQNEVIHSTRIKTYPDGSRQVMVASAPVFIEEGWERTRPAERREREQADGAGDVARAMRRARAQVRDLALCTPFRWFVTLTLDQRRVDRYDVKEITKKLNHWLDNNVRRKGLAYVLVPERHQDGAIHFHGFFNDALEVVDSGHHDREGHPIYNLPGWSLGFTTAIELYGDHHQAVAYVCKYIGKQTEKIGGRWYYSGGQLGRPEVTYADLLISEVADLPNAVVFAVEGGTVFAVAQVGPDWGK